MQPPVRAVGRPAGLARLTWEELKGLPRGRFALGGATILALFLTFLGVVMAAGQENGVGLRGFGLIAYGLVPVALAPFAASRIAGARASRLSQSLFTSPVRQRHWFFANVLVSLLVGLLYILATMPFVAVAAWHLGSTELTADLLPVGIGLVLMGVAIGTLVGVLLSGLAAPIAATAFLFLSFVSAPYLANLAGGSDATFLIRALHIFPHVNLTDAVRFAGGPAVATQPGTAVVALVLSGIGALGVAAWAFLREQGPLGWETTGARRALVLTAALLVLVLPATVSAAEYEVEDNPFDLPHIPERAAIAVVERGATAEGVNLDAAFAGTAARPLRVGETNRVDLLLELPAGHAHGNISATVRLYGNGGENLVQRQVVRVDGVESDLLRLPVDLVPDEPWSLSSNYYILTVEIRPASSQDAQPPHVTVTTPVRADVTGTSLQMAMAGAPAPLLLAAGAIVRRARTR